MCFSIVREDFLMQCIVGIVLYNPNIARLKESFDAIKKSGYLILLVDNGSNNISKIRELIDSKSIVMIENGCNFGIAKALNQIFEYGTNHNIDYILTLDQDSVIPANIFSEYENAANSNEKWGILTPIIFDRNAKYVLDNASSSALITEMSECITSASLVRVQAWKQVEGFDEKMFIDGVDFDFCHRIIDAGFKVLRVNTVVLIHEIGHISIQHIGGLRIVVKNHNAFRKYYIARNIIYLSKKENTSLIYALLKEIKMCLIILLYENNKREKLQAVMKGTIEGVSMDCSTDNDEY